MLGQYFGEKLFEYWGEELLSLLLWVWKVAEPGESAAIYLDPYFQETEPRPLLDPR
jgi:hypothetical protein